MSLCDNSNDGRPCRTDEGEPCAQCQATIDEEDRYWSAQWVVASPEERNPERYRREMIEAGRGHLLP